MEWLFEVIDKSGRYVHLSRERWVHIVTKHTNMLGKLEDIKGALVNPLYVVAHKYDERMRGYYLYYKLNRDYLLVSVKYLNGTGFVATAFVTKKIVKRYGK